MKKIEKETLNIAYKYLNNNCDGLYQSIFEYHFLSGNQDKMIKELRKYQNEDGGFGNGLEPDFLLPASSPMATTIAFQILNELELSDYEMIERAIKYYDKTYDKTRNGWWSVPKEVNDYPHAPWWDYDNQRKCTIIDANWGNPSSEIIGTLYKWKEYSILDVEKLVEYAINHLLNLTEFRSEHELYCFIRMYHQVPEHYQLKLKDQISKGIRELICLDESKWNTYVPKPFEFIQSKKHPLFHEIEEYAERHCDFLVDSIKNGVWQPTWKWNKYESSWNKSKENWTAVLSIKYFRILKEFNRIE